MTGKARLIGKLSSPPTWPKNPRQDSWGNPTTKKAGDTGTAIGFPRNGKQKWLDLYGRNRPHGSRDWN